MRQDVSEFIAAMKRAGEHLQSYSQKTTLEPILERLLPFVREHTPELA